MQHDGGLLPGLSGYAYNPHMPPMSHTINTTTASSTLLPPLPHYPGQFATAAHAPSYPHSYLTGGYVVASDTVQHWPTPLQIPPSMNSEANVNPYSVSSAAYGYAGNEVPWQHTAAPEQNVNENTTARPWQQHAYNNAQSYIPLPPPPYRMFAIPTAAAARTPLAQKQGVRYAVNRDSATMPNVVPHGTNYHTANNRISDVAAHCEDNTDAAMATMSIAHSARRLSTAKRSSAATMLMGSTRRSAYKTRSSYDTSATQTNNKSNNDALSSTLTRTSNTTTTAGGQDESCCVAAVINNGATEIGVALCALPSLTVSIAQYGDSCTFAKTLTLLYTQNPLEVLVPATTVEEPFTQTLLRCFGQEMTFTAVQRRFYQSEAGVRRLHELRSNAELMGGIEDTDRYLCVAAANALLAYMEDINEMQFVPGSVRVRYLALEHYAEIPRASARALHIIRPAYDCPALVPWSSSSAMYSRMGRRTSWTSSANTLAFGERRAAGRRRHYHRHRTHRDNTEEEQQASRDCVNNNNTGGNAVAADSLSQQMSHMLRTTTLIDALPRTCTLHGQRFLRASLLQPLRDRTAIQLRQDVVAWLLADLHRALRLRGHLQLLAGLDMERLIASFSQRPRCMTSARRQQLVQSLLDLWHVLEVLQGLTACLQGYLPHEEKQTTTTSTTKVTQSSTPEQPLLLHHIVDTLAQCELPSLEASLARYLDASVRPSATTNTQTTQSTTNTTTVSRRGGTSGRWTSERPGRRVVLGAAQAALSYNGPLTQPSFTTTNTTNIGGDVTEDAMRRALLRASYDTPRLTHWQPSHSASSSSSSSSAVFALLRICFAVRAPAGSVLDASRSGFSAQIGRIADYHSQLRQAFQLYSLVLRPDPVRLYCFSYSAAEEHKTRGGPFKYKYTGKEDYAHFVRAQLRRQEILQRQQQEGENRSMHESFNGEQQANYESNYNNDDEGEAMNEESVGAQRQARRRLQRLRVQCTTDELEVLCAEARRYCEAILLEETRAVQPLLDTLRGCIGKLQAMTEAVALLDMLLSFTSYALMHRCVRPVLVDRNGRTTEPVECTACGECDTSDMRPAAHPLNETMSPTTQCNNHDDTDGSGAASPRGNVKEVDNTSTTSQPFSLVLARHPSQYLRDEHGSLSSRITAAVPNTLQWACGVHVLLVTGPNTTGKTTLLRQTGQLVALAQSGCFIPAQSARLFIADRIVAHMLCDELPSVTQSSFKRELSELAALSHDVTCESLVLIDELGRSCASRQGFLLAWATVRFLCGRKVHALFTTHALALTELATVLPEVDNVHFSEDAFFLPCDTSTSNVSADTSTQANNTITTTTRGTRCAHCLQPGPCTRQQYGVALAAAIGLPRQVIADATQFLTYMRRLHAAPKSNAEEGTACDEAGEAATESTTTI